MSARAQGLTLAVACGGNRDYPELTCRDVNLDIRVPSSRIPYFVRADALHMPFREKSFNIVFASHIVEHLPNTEAFIEECRRVGCSVELRFPHWAFAGAYSDPTHRWVWIGGKFRSIPRPIHLVFHRIFDNRFVAAVFRHMKIVNQEVVMLIRANEVEFLRESQS